MSNCPLLYWWCQIVLFCMMMSNCPQCLIVLGVKLSHHVLITKHRVSWFLSFGFDFIESLSNIVVVLHPTPAHPQLVPQEISRDRLQWLQALRGRQPQSNPGWEYFERIFWDNLNPTLVDNIFLQTIEYLGNIWFQARYWEGKLREATERASGS